VPAWICPANFATTKNGDDRSMEEASGHLNASPRTSTDKTDVPALASLFTEIKVHGTMIATRVAG